MRQPVKRYSKVFLNLSLAFVVLLLCIFVVPKVLLFFLPFIIGWVIAAIANRPVHFFEEKFRIKRKASSAFVIITVIAIVVLAGYMLITRLASATIGFITVLPELWENLEQDFMEIGQNLLQHSLGLPIRIGNFSFRALFCNGNHRRISINRCRGRENNIFYPMFTHHIA